MLRKSLNELAEEIASYKREKQYATCIQKMDQYEKAETDPLLRAVVLTAKATCASQMGDTSSAEQALSNITMSSLPTEMQGHVNLVKASIAQSAHRLEEADLLLDSVIGTSQSFSQEHRDLQYEALARKGFIQADLNRFSEALEFLLKAEKLGPAGELSENINLYRGYCLQALGELDAAERVLKTLVSDSCGEMEGDAYYRLGAVQLQKKDLYAAKQSFRKAFTSARSRAIRESDILQALHEVDNQLEGPNDPQGSGRPAQN